MIIAPVKPEVATPTEGHSVEIPPLLPPVTKILMDARAIIERGWIQGTLQNNQGVCAIGALRKAWTTESYWRDDAEALRLLKESLPKYLFIFQWKMIHRFNDFHMTRKKDVLALYDRAIQKSLK